MSDVKIPSGGTTSVPFPQGSYDVAVSVPPRPTVSLVTDIGPPGTSIVWRGVWSAGTAYNVQDAVSHVGANAIVSSYICLQANTGQAPAEGTSTAYWGMLAQEGATGAQGLQGPPGAVGPPVPIHDEGSDLTVWTPQFVGAGTLSIQTVADSSVGGKVIRAAGYVGTVRAPLVPYDPGALYKVKFRVRQTVNPSVGGSAFYAGLEGVAADGVTPVNYTGANDRNQHYIAAVNVTLTVAGGWQEFVGYVKGVAATGSNTPCPGPSAPGRMHQNVRYIRPILYINHLTGNGTAEIDYVSLEIVPEPVTPLPLYDECGSLAEWVKFGGAGTVSVETVADSAVGGKVIRNVGGVSVVRMPLVPFDPTALYRVRLRIRQTVNEALAAIHAGIEGVGADGITLVNTTGANSRGGQHQILVSGTVPTVADGWLEYVAYVKGTAATGTALPPTTPSAPGKMHTNVRYIRPYYYTGWGGASGTGTAEIDYVSLEIVPEPATPLPLYDECGSLTEWVKFSGAGTASVANVADSAVGGNVIRCVGHVSFVRTAPTPYDPNALYRIKFRVRQTVDGAPNNGVYAGFEGIAANGTTLVNSTGADSHNGQHYMAASGALLTVAGGWQEFVGYVKGLAATGTTTPTPTPSAPGVMHQSTRYIRPYIQINYAGGTGTAEIDYVSLEIVPSDVVTADTAEIDFSGGTGGTPLSAALTGTRSGDWVVPAGVLAVGDVNQSTTRHLSLRVLAAADQYEGSIYAHPTSGALVVHLKKNTVEVNRFALQPDGSLVAIVGAVSRPIPFATYASVTTIVVTATDKASNAVTFPAGRFTQSPLVFTALNQGTPMMVTSFSSVVAGGATITARHMDAAAVSTTVNVNFFAVQMAPGAAPGLLALEPEGSAYVVTCHTEDCENGQIPITLHIVEEGIPVFCGVCGQPITDVVTP